MKQKEHKSRNRLEGSIQHVGDLPFEVAFRRFRKKIEDSGLLRELKDRMHYEKPTTARKAKKNAARRRWERELQKQQLPKKNY